MPTPPSVLQPSFAQGKAPTSAAAPAADRTAPAGPAPVQTKAGGLWAVDTRPPHPATVMQKKSPPGPAQRPPHPATVMQRREPPAKPTRPPHPATLPRTSAAGTAQRAAASARPPHPATLPRGAAVQPAMERRAFPAPAGFLRNASWDQGTALPPAVQRAMEHHFGGADFSAVRVHEGRDAESLGALAFTTGEDIYFARGQYRPGSRSGEELLGRQLAFVLQQRAGRVKNPFGGGVAVVQDPALEAEAARMAGR